jgi:hypothetical protein
MLFWLPEYDRAAKEVFFWSVDALTDAIEPALAAFPRDPVEQVPTTRIAISEDRTLRVKPGGNESLVRFDNHRVVAGDLTAVLEEVDRLAAEVAPARLAFMSQFLEQLTDATGQTVPGGAMSWEVVMAAIEKAGTGFDEHDQPTFVIWPPEAAAAFDALPPRTPEQENAWRDLMARKRKEHRAKRSRRSVA